MILLIDNFDSFSYNLVDYLERCEEGVEVIRNNESLEKGDLDRISGVVISPGPGTPSSSGYLMDWLGWFIATKPVLGICLGHQAIGEQFGAQLIKARKPMHGKISQINHSGDILFNGLPNPFEAVRYNSLVISETKELQVIAECNSEIMGVKHKELPVWGVQFHPEAALTKFGSKIISNWLEYNNIV